MVSVSKRDSSDGGCPGEDRSFISRQKDAMDEAPQKAEMSKLMQIWTRISL